MQQYNFIQGREADAWIENNVSGLFSSRCLGERNKAVALAGEHA
tara:strand:+ start:197 stop:328 length:132 start_codon:yes stop_codon:yes gene_type:complete